MAVQGYSIAFTRYQAIDFSVPFNEETTTILIPAPVEESHLFVCIRPFQWQVYKQ